MEALYTKYRPKVFSEIVGQEHIKQTLRNEIRQNRLAHAYLFCGPRGIAKTTTARILAKVINCKKREKNEDEPCTKCESCLAIQEGKFLDLIEIDAASHTGVDNVRENIIENSHVAPSQAEYKVFIIDEVHMLSLSAFNALLKLLEEPPKHAIYILATTEVHKIPNTIISRCQRFDFKKIDHKSMLGHLKKLVEAEGKEVEEKILERIVKRSQGHARDAISILSQVLSIGDIITEKEAELILPKTYEDDIWKFIKQLDKEPKVNLEYLEKLMNDGLNVIEFSKELVEFSRQLLLIKASKKLDHTCSLDLDQKTFKEVLEWIKSKEVDTLIRMLELFMETELQTKNDTYVMQLPLEIAIIKLTDGYEDIRKQEVEEEEEEINQKKVIKQIAKENKKPDVQIKKGKTEIKEKIIKPKEERIAQNQKEKEQKSSLGKDGLLEEHVRKNWNTIIEALKKESQPLAMTLNMGSVKEVTGDTILLEYGYQFHAEFVLEAKNKKIIEEIIATVLNSKAKIQTTVGSKQKIKEIPKQQGEEEKKDIEEALDVFGGQVVG